MAFRNKWQLPLSIVLIFMGILISVQYRTQRDFIASLELQSPTDLVIIWTNVMERKSSLENEVTKLRQEKNELLEAHKRGQSQLETLTNEKGSLELAGGFLPAKGPGITITFTEKNQLLYLDLIDVVNELWSSGAEAIAINEERLTNASSISDSVLPGMIGITVNENLLSYPIVIKAIGNPQNLDKSLTIPGGLIANFNALYRIYPQITVSQELLLPSVSRK